MHKLDSSKGQAAFIAYQAPAWHGLGKVFNNEITIEQVSPKGIVYIVVVC